MTIKDFKDKLKDWKVSDDVKLIVDGYDVDLFWLTNSGDVEINSKELLDQQDEFYKSLNDYETEVDVLRSEKVSLKNELECATEQLECCKDDLEALKDDVSKLAKEYF